MQDIAGLSPSGLSKVQDLKTKKLTNNQNWTIMKSHLNIGKIG